MTAPFKEGSFTVVKNSYSKEFVISLCVRDTGHSIGKKEQQNILMKHPSGAIYIIPRAFSFSITTVMQFTHGKLNMLEAQQSY